MLSVPGFFGTVLACGSMERNLKPEKEKTMQTNPRLKKLKQRREQIEARIKNLEARDRSREKKRDTRRKILIGAFFMEQMEKDEPMKKKILAGLNGFLVRANDRELFGLDKKKPVDKPGAPTKLPEKRKQL